ncbi:MAG: CatB-related O-acetyltransferase [Verrucomicrobiota bacterium]|nr:CatB-related O-acetyltransferase [Verrucomicrobiota bacterium]
MARWFYGRTPSTLQGCLRRLVLRLEGGPVYSCSIREIFWRYHGVSVGMYTIGPCESEPSNFAAGTRIGRYCSVYYTAMVLSQSGPEEPVFVGGPAWDPRRWSKPKYARDPVGVDIGHDVYIGHNAVILPSVQTIGHGAVIGAGSVVHDDVPPYAVVTGNPARVVRYRFRAATIEKLLAEQWWLKTIDELAASRQRLDAPLEDCIAGS